MLAQKLLLKSDFLKDNWDRIRGYLFLGTPLLWGELLTLSPCDSAQEGEQKRARREYGTQLYPSGSGWALCLAELLSHVHLQLTLILHHI